MLDCAQVPHVSSPPPPSQGFGSRRGPVRALARLWESWATRSLAMGAVATALDILVLLLCVKALLLPNPVGAMIGVVAGSIWTFFANRYIAFRDHDPNLAPQAAKFALATFGSMWVHAGAVWLLADRLGLNVVLAKLLADIAIFSVGQLVLLRYVVFPRRKPEALVPVPERLPEIAG